MDLMTCVVTPLGPRSLTPEASNSRVATHPACGRDERRCVTSASQACGSTPFIFGPQHTAFVQRSRGRLQLVIVTIRGNAPAVRVRPPLAWWNAGAATSSEAEAALHAVAQRAPSIEHLVHTLRLPMKGI